MSWVCRVALLLAMVPVVMVGRAAFSLQSPGPSLADSMAGKLNLIRERFEKGESEPSDFELSEEEANAYLEHHLSDRLPEGVRKPWVRFTDGPVWAGAELDLDTLRNRMPQSTVAQFLSGRLPVEIGAYLKAEGGVGELDLHTVTLGGIPVPKSLVQELVTAYTKTPERPEGLRLNEPFALPYGIESARSLEGALKLHQGGDPGTPRK